MASSDNWKFASGNAQMLRFESNIEDKNSLKTSSHLEEIQGHIERNIGPVKALFNELESDTIHLDILIVPATSDRKFHYLVTSGMSDLPMLIDPRYSDSEGWCFAELVIALPKYWPLFDSEKMQSERWNFPIEHLKFLARMPHKYDSWISVGHSIPNFESKKRIGPNCEMSGFVIDNPVLGGEEFTFLNTRAGKEIRFCGVYPIYQNEMQYKVRKGYSALQTLFREKSVTEIFYPDRPSLVRRNLFSLFGF